MNDSAAPAMRLAVRTFGTGAPLVLFHGGMGSWRHWVRNLDALAAQFTVHAVDLPGYGDSPTVSKSMPRPDYIELVVQGVNAIVGSQPFRLAGFSFGGVAAAMTAARMGERVSQLSLMGVGGFGPSGKLPMRAIPDGLVGDPGRREVLRHNLLTLMLADPASVTDEAIDIYDDNYRTTRFDGRGFSMSNSVVESLERIRGPVQFIYGDRDALAHADLERRARLVRSKHPAAQFVVLPGPGHWVQYEAAGDVNRLLIEFLAA